MRIAKSGQTFLLAAALTALFSGVASAHCDRADGPVANDARTALETGDFTTIAAWVGDDQTDELQAAFEKSRAVRADNGPAREVADQWFIETAVRLHRTAEGMPYTGVQPAGLPVEPAVAAADRAYETGEIEPVIELLQTSLAGRVREQFGHAFEAKEQAGTSLQEKRERVDAYVRFIVYTHSLYESILSGPEHGVGESQPPAESHSHNQHGAIMKAINTQMTVGDLVTEQPGRSRVFEELGIDYCCGGNRTLDDACAGKGLDVETVVERLEAEDGARTNRDEINYGAMPLTDLVNHIVDTHHVYLKKEMPRISQIVQKVAQAHGDSPKGNELRDLATVFAELKAELDSHMMKEERILFPLIARVDAGETGLVFDGPISVMMREHDSAGEALEAIRSLSDNFTLPEWGCNTYRAMLDALSQFEQDLHIHIHKENNILFPRAQAAVQS